MSLSKYVKNKGVRLHYIDSFEKADKKMTPLVVCPGLSETAEEYIDLLELVLPRRCILISFRGRGQSDTPDNGYNLDDHVSDIESVVRDCGVNSFHLFGFSRGVSYALSYAQKHTEQIKSIILGDYPPEHRSMPANWSKDYIENYLIPFNRTDHIRSKAVLGIQRESTKISLENTLSVSLLLARGMLNDSLVTDCDIKRYEKICATMTIKEYHQSGHDIKEKEQITFYNDIVNFLDQM